jgi:hypothetical protein
MGTDSGGRVSGAQASITCVQSGPLMPTVDLDTLKAEGEEVYKERKNLSLSSKTLRVRRLYDKENQVLVRAFNPPPRATLRAKSPPRLHVGSCIGVYTSLAAGRRPGWCCSAKDLFKSWEKGTSPKEL